MWAYQQFQPPKASPGSVAFTVARGESVRDIAQGLHQDGLIRNVFLFRLYVSYEHKGASIQAGHYMMQLGAGIPQIVQELSHGEVVGQMITLTIPEGYTIQQIAQRMQDNHVCTKADFLKSAQGDHFDEPFLALLPRDPKIKYRLEGYLFPDTYEFKRGTSAHNAIDEMLRNFERRTSANVMEKVQSPSNLADIITEASIVEREAKVDSERPLIASVIVNRMKIHMKLQMDATLQYILGHQEIVTAKDTKVNDPYNTYLNVGLPPGPIGSPGMSSILAALSPAHTDYLYYVVKNNGTGTDYFATTYAQQMHNEQLSQANLKTYGH